MARDFVFEEGYSHEPTLLTRSTRERKSAMLDDYIIFLQEHEVNIGVMEDYSIIFCQAIESSNSHRWIDGVNE